MSDRPAVKVGDMFARVHATARGPDSIDLHPVIAVTSARVKVRIGDAPLTLRWTGHGWVTVPHPPHSSAVWRLATEADREARALIDLRRRVDAVFSRAILTADQLRRIEAIVLEVSDAR